MLATEKDRLTVYIDPNLNEELRIAVARHRGANMSSFVEDALRYCLGNRHFLDKLKEKHTKEPQF